MSKTVSALVGVAELLQRGAIVIWTRSLQQGANILCSLFNRP